MQQYINIHHFTPKKRYPNNGEILFLIDSAIQNLYIANGSEKKMKKTLATLKQYVVACMYEYNQLTGVTEEVINDYISNTPNGILPRYVEAVLGYFIHSSLDNEAINILKYSGIKEIKIRYKHADSVIKKLVKNGFNNIQKVQDPTKVFLRGGLLHDLIGIQFICAYPYQAEWLARALYHFFKIPNRTDDHLSHGFYSIDRDSGYKGLHCDRTYWNPAFDAEFIKKSKSSILPKDITSFSNIEISDSSKLLNEYHQVFNIEIQIQTSFQNIWAKMEHEKSYDILAKGRGKSQEITVLWKMLSDNLSSIEEQFQKLQVKTEQYVYQDDMKEGYGFISRTLETDKETQLVFNKSVEMIRKLEIKLKHHEIARIDYIFDLEKEIKFLESYLKSHPKLEQSAVFSIKLQIAFIYYSFSNHRKDFNAKDIANFLSNSVKYYNEIIHSLCHEAQYRYVRFKDLMIINAVIRYGQLSQKYGLGLINKSIIEEDIPFDIGKQNTNQIDGIQYVGYGLYIFTNLNDFDLNILKSDKSSFFRTVDYLDKFSRDIELSGETSIIIKGLNGRDFVLEDLIKNFRKKYMNKKLEIDFMYVLDGNDKMIITNTSFIVSFLSTLIINKLEKPINILERVVHLSSHESIKASDIFLYEYASYLFSYEYALEAVRDDDNQDEINHYGKYHYENMINLLFRIKREEDIYEFIKARTYFNNIKGRDNFKEDYLSSMLKNR
ncbi:MAG: Unknown protein [uncultured Sulfurovum sp.]|uniref:RelA/SpoT domain-containing protein n=1 Tax=uncultured Sulfurovum sp. TaxID=269237 RepID=A0A6S6TC74_9BACT|nr:MAG: Unknown protein [uncultured Sulfurovum sp.]